MTPPRNGYGVLLVASLLWTVGTVAAPILHHHHADTSALAARLFYAPVCHQDAPRSQHLFGYPISVCHRCGGIYLAFTLTVALFPFFRGRFRAASFSPVRGAIFIVPMFLDYMLDVAGVWTNDALTRTVTGFIGGSGLALFVVPAWTEAWCQIFGRITNHQPE
ncbi:MAG: DUF2085 domain-containing protein [Bacteroidia bacterium]|nr:DUF2085 domain-containing protein [Bacteroidia bacterium]